MFILENRYSLNSFNDKVRSEGKENKKQKKIRKCSVISERSDLRFEEGASFNKERTIIL